MLTDEIHGKHYLLASDVVPFLTLLSLETGLELECCKELTVIVSGIRWGKRSRSHI